MNCTDDIELNTKKMLDLIDEATIGTLDAKDKKPNETLNSKGRGTNQLFNSKPNIICFPECSLTGYCLDKLDQTALVSEDIHIEKIKERARLRQCDVIFGYFEKNFIDSINNTDNAEKKEILSNPSYYISQCYYSHSGKSFVYRKTHLGVKESGVLLPGNYLDTFEIALDSEIAIPSQDSNDLDNNFLSNKSNKEYVNITAGMLLCIEGHVPKAAEALTLKGAEILFLPHSAIKGAGNRKEIWNKYLMARAYDNRCFVLACNQLGKNSEGREFAGGCVAYSPEGEIIAEDFSEQEGICFVELDMKETKKYRDADLNSKSQIMNGRFFLNYNRPELYR